MKKIFLLTALIVCFSSSLLSQEKENNFGIKLKGYVKYEMIYDSRQQISSRDEAVLLFPAPVDMGEGYQDINAGSQFNFLSLTSRLKGIITGPKAFGAETSGMISADFAGTDNEKVGLIRLRHAFLKLKWEHSTLLAGKYWHPLFSDEVFPHVLAFGAAIPCYMLNRAPQLTYKVHAKGFSLALSASAQHDFKSRGPEGKSAQYLINSGAPELTFRAEYKNEHLLLGAAFGLWKIKPTLTDTAGRATDVMVNGHMLNTFAQFTFDGFVLRGGYIVGENISQLNMFGGYGVTEIDEYGIISYAPTKGSSVWAEMAVTIDNWCMGLFGGYTRNHGSEEKITGPVYALAPNIANYLRISPRLTYKSGNVQVGLEGVYHSAAYGTPDEYYVVQNAKGVDAFRLMTCVAYYF
ncbi:MAG: hypothetical protein C0593_08495 [Marinilabiliales bacterium]|nr:MAG: hypothetical protein C0593_08495 [Marinilabiliales bacterium]